MSPLGKLLSLRGAQWSFCSTTPCAARRYHPVLSNTTQAMQH